MADEIYNSRHTGPDIDDAVDKIRNTGGTGTAAITAAQVGAAPAGYGLGGNAKLLTSADNLDNIRENGWYWWYDTRPSGAEYNYCHMRVDNGNTGTLSSVTQTIYRNGSNSVMVRYYNNGTWITEWVNPPMENDRYGRYDTTERYEGIPVTKKIDKGFEVWTADNNLRGAAAEDLASTGKSMLLYIGPDATVNVPLLAAHTYLISASDNVRSGVYIVQAADSTVGSVTKIVPGYNWEVKAGSGLSVDVKELNGRYPLHAFITMI